MATLHLDRLPRTVTPGEVAGFVRRVGKLDAVGPVTLRGTGAVGARRPSHADKRRAWRRDLLAEHIHTVPRPGLTEAEIRAAAERLVDLAA